MRIPRAWEAGRDAGGTPMTTRPTGEHVSWAWVVAGVLFAGAWFGLPRYLDTLDRTIVFADPDCMQVTAVRAARGGVTLEERVDSTEAWTMACLDERQGQALRRANVVGWTANALIALAGLIALLMTVGWLRAIRATGGNPRS